MSELIPAYAYYRMSSDDQTDSIERQQKEVRPYAKRQGYRIVREYLDEGKSGSKDQEKRVDFQRMLMDCTNRQEVKAVLCWDASRFTRLDIIDGSFAAQVLRSNGMVLDTVKEGRFDLSTAEGRWKFMAYCENNTTYSRNLSKDTISGRLRVLEQGFWPNGAVPYGFDRLYVFGTQERFVPRSEPGQKAKHWKLRLVRNEEELKVIQFIFERYVNWDWSRRQIALELNKQGVLAPDSLARKETKGWTHKSVKRVLTELAYIGAYHIGKGPKRAKEAFNRAQPTVKEDCCSAIVSREMFKAAQEKLARDEELGLRIHNGRTGIRSPLSGVVYCGHCGYALEKKVRKGRVYFQCSMATRRPHLGCHQWRAYQDQVLPSVCSTLVEEVDAEVLKGLQVKPDSGSIRDTSALEEEIQSLRDRIGTGVARLAKIQEDLLSDYQAHLAGLKQQLAEAESQLQVMKALENQHGIHAFFEWWSKAKDRLVLIAKGGHQDLGDISLFGMDEEDGYTEFTPVVESPNGVLVESDTLRALLKRLGVRLSLYWKHRPEKEGKSKGWRYGRDPIWELDRGRMNVEIKWHCEHGNSQHSNRGSHANSPGTD